MEFVDDIYELFNIKDLKDLMFQESQPSIPFDLS